MAVHEKQNLLPPDNQASSVLPPLQQVPAVQSGNVADTQMLDARVGIPPLRTAAELPPLRELPAQEVTAQQHAMLRLFGGYAEPTMEEPSQPPGGSKPKRLQTGQNARAVVLPWLSGSYQVAYRSGEGKDDIDVVMATFRFSEIEQSSKATLQQMPLYIDDFTLGDKTLIRVKYDPVRVQLESQQAITTHQGHAIRLEATPVPPEELTMAKGPGVKSVRGGFVAEGGETILQHQSTREDRIASSIADAEGGFATVEASDAGIFTWGQGQWTVTEERGLQALLAFIKDRRADLFERYWHAVGLDVKGQGSSAVFVYQGHEMRGQALEKVLFRPTPEQNRLWTTIFAQAGMDPQIQRLQREYLRQEVQEEIGKPVTRSGARQQPIPQEWLNERGLSLYYSAKKNLPSSAEEYLIEAAAKIAPNKKGSEIDDAIRDKVSAYYEERFKNSPVVAWQFRTVLGKKEREKHYALGFWGQQGRKAAVERDEALIKEAEGDDKKKKEWQVHHDYLLNARPSRYESTVQSINKVKRTPSEPDVPEDARDEIERQWDEQALN